MRRDRGSKNSRSAQGTRRLRRRLASIAALLLPLGFLPAVEVLTAVPAHGANPVGQGFNLNPADLRFILQQIKISERHVETLTPTNPCRTLLGNGPDQIPNGNGAGVELPWGLRTVDGTCNNLRPNQGNFGATDQEFVRITPKTHRLGEAAPAGPNWPPGNAGPGNPSNYGLPGTVYDTAPRMISNLIVDQTVTNESAVHAAGGDAVPCVGANDPAGCVPDGETLFIPNQAPDVGLSAPYNSMFTLFGQFFDHGLDLTQKGAGSVFIPLRDDDPLIPGPDGILGNADDLPPALRFMVVSRAPANAKNVTSPYVDQSQTYGSDPSHHVFLREYELRNGLPVSNGKMLRGEDGGLATWADVKTQAREMLGIELDDLDALDVPMLAVDPYGRFHRGANGLPQLVTQAGMVPANLGTPVDVPNNARRMGHAFLVDIAHTAGPVSNNGGPAVNLEPDTDTLTGNTPPAGRYDNELLERHFVAGDGRVNENIGLTTVHHIFHSEHNRLAGDATVEGSIKNVLVNEDPSIVPEWEIAPGVWNGERILQAARFVTEMEYQHLVFEEFGRKVQPMINLFSGYDTSINAAIMGEFAHSVYRFGHSMLTEDVDRVALPGSPPAPSMGLIEAFLNPVAYNEDGTLSPEEAAGSVVRGMTAQVGNELDEFVTEALRNNLLGLPLDLATINLGRGREAGIPTLNEARRQFFTQTGDSAVRPYDSWMDFGFGIRHPKSLINFVAAYGRHPSILQRPGPDGILLDDPTTTGVDESADNLAPTLASRRRSAARLVANDPLDPDTPADSAQFIRGTGAWANARTSGLDDIDLWMGGLAEKQAPFGGLLGSTMNFVFELQMENLQDGDRFYYLSRTAGLNLLVQLEGNSLAEIISRNTDATGLPADVFSRPDFVFDLAAQTDPATIVDDVGTSYDETQLLVRQNGFVRFTGGEHVLFIGTENEDRMWASEGDDTLRGNDNRDWIEGGSGNDGIIGGLGNDIITDTFGDDTLKGGDGHDAMSSGPGFDLNQGGRGKDFIVGGSDPTESFGGPGNDFIFAGASTDIVFGDDGNDWIEGGGQADLLQGDNGAPFQDDPNTPGDDVLIGGGGADDYDSEGGNDVMVAGPGIERNEGMLGFDWTIHKGDPQAALDDMEFTGLLPDSLDAFRDRFDLTESLSGWNLDDVLRGDDRLAADMVGHELRGNKLDQVAGLRALLGSTATGNQIAFNSGNILLGGSGSDTLEGRGGDDFIDGDAWYDVYLQTGTRTADSMMELQADVFNGSIDPSTIEIVREIVPNQGAAGVDLAQFSDAVANYDCIVDGGPVQVCTHLTSGQNTRVIHARGTQIDGTDEVRNVERLVFADSVVPGPPTILGVTPLNGAATLAFDPAPTTVANSFVIQVLTAPGGVQVGALRQVNAGDTTVTVGGLTNGQAVQFRVAGINDLGQGEFSALSPAVTPAPTVATVPTAVTTTPDDRSVTVEWGAPADDGGSPVDVFELTVHDEAGVQIGGVRNAAGAARSFVVDGLTNGTGYRFRVAAVNTQGAGPRSDLTPVTTPRTVPDAPTIVSATFADRSATVEWTAPDIDGGAPITGYEVQLLDGTGSPLAPPQAAGNGTARSFVVADLTNGDPYRFQVRAINEAGNSLYSTRSETVTPARAADAPTIDSVTPREDSAVVRWTAPTVTGGVPITGYEVQVTDQAGTPLGAPQAAGGAAARQFVVTGLTPGERYRFRVRALNAAGPSSFSALSPSQVVGLAPARPGIRNARAGRPGGVVDATARWNRPAADGGLPITGYVVRAIRIRPNRPNVTRTFTAAPGPRRLTMTLRRGNYRFRVAAVNEIGRSPFSPRSNRVVAR